MTLFTVGPVEMYPETLEIEGSQLPYFRTVEFSRQMQEIENWFLASIHAPEDASFLALTASGTGAMDAAVQNMLGAGDQVLVINGGSFGKRFADIVSRYQIPADVYEIPYGRAFSREAFEGFGKKKYTALLVNSCETSTGQLYDLSYLGEYCRKQNLLFIVDAVSSYLADDLNMEAMGIDVLITSSQKALALSPGVSLIALSGKAKERIGLHAASYYFDFATYLENQKRGQPPFTSAVGIMLALHQRLEGIHRNGLGRELSLHAGRAMFFRERVRSLPLEIPQIPLSNCCTPLLFPKKNAVFVYEQLKDRYGLVLTPSGGDWKDLQLRVGHLGNLSRADYETLLSGLNEVLKGTGEN